MNPNVVSVERRSAATLFSQVQSDISSIQPVAKCYNSLLEGSFNPIVAHWTIFPQAATKISAEDTIWRIHWFWGATICERKATLSMNNESILLVQIHNIEHSRKLIPNFITWSQCFVIYTTFLGMSQPQRLLELIWLITSKLLNEPKIQMAIMGNIRYEFLPGGSQQARYVQGSGRAEPLWPMFCNCGQGISRQLMQILSITGTCFYPFQAAQTGYRVFSVDYVYRTGWLQ